MRHTKEPWSARINETVTIRDGQDNQIGILTHLHTKSGGRRDADEVAANARRIVACVNACAGLSNEELENPVSSMAGRLRQIQANAHNRLKDQRDELLAALKRASETIGRFVSDEGWAQKDMDCMDDIDAIIAKAEAGQ